MTTYFIRRDLQNVVQGPTGVHSTIPIIDAATLCELMQKAYNAGFKAGCDACQHPTFDGVPVIIKPLTGGPAKPKKASAGA